VDTQVIVINLKKGGKTENPTYKEVCGGETGHAEVCQIEYDTDVLTFDDILQLFWKCHDPTQLNVNFNLKTETRK
jgi:methionine-S-sulfoxide reductase